ncbi:MAG: DNA polymerase I [Smithellaceae bacterium]|nr:DNA polymerase I [Smithellaceae bacterium]
MDKPLILIDGSNYVYRAYYAISGLSNSRGFPTNAIYGFTNMLLKIIREWKPDYLAVVFDLRGPTFRHELFPAYKSTRKATPEDLAVQLPRIKEIIRGFSIPVIERQGIEADDIIGALAAREAKRGGRVVIASGDKDMMQLVSPLIIMVDAMHDKTYDLAAVRERFGVEPEKVPEIMGLTGDASDNIPGVPGVGPKTARRFIEEFGSIENLIAHVDRLRNPAQRKAVADYAALAILSRDLARIRTETPLEITREDCRLGEPDREVLAGLFREFEFSALLQDLQASDRDLTGIYHLLESREDFASLLAGIREAGAFSLEVIADGPATQASLRGIAISPSAGQAWYLSFEPDMDMGESGAAIKAGLAAVLGDEGIKKYGHDLKTAAIILEGQGLKPSGLHFDAMVAAYLLNPTRRNFELPEVAREHLNLGVMSRGELLGEGTRAVTFDRVERVRLKDFACRRADAVMRLVPLLEAKIEEGGFRLLFYEMEMPLVTVLAEMEAKGVLLDCVLLKEMSQGLDQLMAAAEKKIHQLAGEKFNINSPKQLQAVLFDKLKLPKGKKIKEGYSTNSEILSSLALTHELPAEILAWRSIVKLKTTYCDALPLLINPATGRLHTSYNQTVTATGRLSSSNPNLQNIPIKTLEGRRIRQSFVAPSGGIILSADYSQIELRVLAHLSQDATLLETFAADEDIHSRTAADVFGGFPELVTPEMRRQAKVINFGILYGMGAFSLSRELGVTQKLAQDYIDEYFHRYKGVKAYLEGILAGARKDGYVSTLFHRIRYLPEIVSGNAPVRQFAERTAINTPIQGTAADLIKLAMVRIALRLRRQKMKAAMIMQVHDELVFEAPREEREELIALVREGMEGVAKLAVPLKVDIASGNNWDEAHS